MYEIINGISDTYLEEAFRDEGPHKQKKRYRWVKMVIYMAASFMLLFIGVVNLFPSVAFAMNDVFLLGDLAKAVTFDASIRACLENEYAQYVGETQVTEDGHYSKVYCMVVDPSRISIFFETDVSSGIRTEGDLYFNPYLFTANGEEIDNTTNSRIIFTDVENLYEYRVDFVEGFVPGEVQFLLRNILAYRPNVGEDYETAMERNTQSKSIYYLYPAEEYRTIVRTFEINETVEIDGQILYLEKLNIYPTQASLWLKTDEDNTAILNDIEVYLYDDRGKKYSEPVLSYKRSDSFDQSSSMTKKWFDSAYFSKTDYICVVISAAEFIPKEKQYGEILYENQSISNIPEGVDMEMSLDEAGNLTISLVAAFEKWRFFVDLVDGKTLENAEFVYPVETSQARSGDLEDGTFYHYFTYTFPANLAGKYKLKWNYAPKTELEEPIEIILK